MRRDTDRYRETETDTERDTYGETDSFVETQTDTERQR